MGRGLTPLRSCRLPAEGLPCAAGTRALPRQAALRGEKRGHGRDKPCQRVWGWPWDLPVSWQGTHCSCVPQEM